MFRQVKIINFCFPESTAVVVISTKNLGEKYYLSNDLSKFCFILWFQKRSEKINFFSGCTSGILISLTCHLCSWNMWWNQDELRGFVEAKDYKTRFASARPKQRYGHSPKSPDLCWMLVCMENLKCCIVTQIQKLSLRLWKWLRECKRHVMGVKKT